MNFKIRPMVKADRETVVRILKNTPEFTREEVEVATELMDIYLERGEDSGYYHAVAQTEFMPVGYICYGPTPMTQGTWDIYWMAVDSGRQRQGIGRSLLEYAEHKIAGTGARMILIETSSQPLYEKTRKFYESMKYTVVATVNDFYTVNDDKLILQKKTG